MNAARVVELILENGRVTDSDLTAALQSPIEILELIWSVSLKLVPRWHKRINVFRNCAEGYLYITGMNKLNLTQYCLLIYFL